jgi:hypothetical protein
MRRIPLGRAGARVCSKEQPFATQFEIVEWITSKKNIGCRPDCAQTTRQHVGVDAQRGYDRLKNSRLAYVAASRALRR